MSIRNLLIYITAYFSSPFAGGGSYYREINLKWVKMYICEECYSLIIHTWQGIIELPLSMIDYLKINQNVIYDRPTTYENECVRTKWLERIKKKTNKG